MKEVWKMYKSSGRNKHPELYQLTKRKRLNENQHREIMKTYLSVYFNEVYFFDRPFYFLLGGLIRKGRCGNWIRETKTTKKITTAPHAIGLFWYNRPFPKFWYSVDIKKVKGGSVPIPRIERLWKRTNDITKLKVIFDMRMEFKEKKLLFRKTKS